MHKDYFGITFLAHLPSPRLVTSKFWCHALEGPMRKKFIVLSSLRAVDATCTRLHTHNRLGPVNCLHALEVTS